MIHSLKPYLIRAVRDWAVDSGLTPYILVNTGVSGVKVPQGYTKDGQIVLNVHPDAVNQWDLNNDWVLFAARFGGRSQSVDVPIAAVMAVYAKENNQGIAFPDTPEGTPEPPDSTPPRKGPSLRVVK